MAKYKVVGVSRKKGEYQGVQYDNVMLHTQFDADGMLAGDAVKQFKVKVSQLGNVFCDAKTPQPIHIPEDCRQLVGHEIKIYCDTYGNPEEIVYLK